MGEIVQNLIWRRDGREQSQTGLYSMYLPLWVV